MLDEWILNLLEECKVQPLLEEVVSFAYASDPSPPLTSDKNPSLSCFFRVITKDAILASHQHIYNNAYYCIPITSMARFYEGCTNHILPFYFTNKVSHSIVSLELILGFNVQAQSPGSMIRFDVQERELKHWQANTPAQCLGSMH